MQRGDTKSRAMWKGNGLSSAKLRALGFYPIVPAEDGRRRPFEHLREKKKKAG